MTVFVIYFALISLCRALKSLCMNGITTFITAIWHLMYFSIVVRFLDLVCHLIFKGLVWFMLTSWSSLLTVSICGKLCSLVSHQINLSDLQISSYLFNMTHSGLWALELFHQLLNSAAREFVQVNMSFCNISRTKSSSHKKNQKMSWCSIFTVSGGLFVRFTCVCTVLYHLLMLLFPWWKLVNRSN